jgi:hypothetical protein
MKKTILALSVVFIMTACTKQSTEQNESQIETIGLQASAGRAATNETSNVAPGPKYTIIPGTKVQVGVNTFECNISSDICFLIGPIYYLQNPDPNNEGFDAIFTNSNGRLKATFFKNSISTNEMSSYFTDGMYRISKTKYFNEEITTGLNFTSPVLIKAGAYKIIEVTNDTFSVIF